jgi:hypothetical protein
MARSTPKASAFFLGRDGAITGAPLQERIRPPVRQRHISRQGLCASAAFQRQLPLDRGAILSGP